MTPPGIARVSAAGLVLVGALLAGLRADPVAHLPWLLAALLPFTAGWLLGARLAIRDAGPSLRWILVVSLLARLAMLLPDVPLSDDLHRYLWDGRVGNAGINPFRHAPAAPELEALRDDRVWPRINHPDVPTIYPPVAQLYFRLLDAMGGAPRASRLAAALLDTSTVWLLAVLLAGSGRPRALALLYGWCPLSALESGGGGHVDALAIALLVAGLLLLVRARPRPLAAGLALGLSTLVKPVAPLLLPALLRRAGSARERGWLLAGGAAALVTVLPYVDAGAGLFAGLRTYARHWQFNDALYHLFVDAGADPVRARLGLALAAAAAALALALVVRDRLAAGSAVVAAALLASPTVHPWYVTWLAALLPFAPATARRAFTLFVAVAPVAYVSAWGLARTGEWSEPGWLWWVSWGAPLSVLAWDRVRGAASREGSG